jgi:hypothetical protein
MPCHEVVTAALLRDMRELRGMISVCKLYTTKLANKASA